MNDADHSKDKKAPNETAAALTADQAAAFAAGVGAVFIIVYAIPAIDPGPGLLGELLFVLMWSVGGSISVAIFELFKRRRFGSAAAVLAGVVGICAVFAATRPSGAEIVEFGIYRLESSGEAEKSFASVQFLETGGALKIVERTNRLPDTLGIRFGIEFVVTAVIEGGEADISVRVLHPRIKGSIWTETTKLATIGERLFGGYHFDYEFEQRSGTWTFQVIHEGNILAEKSFQVTDS
jgi:hypothetical protein